MIDQILNKLRPNGDAVPRHTRKLARDMIVRADSARDARKYHEAATLYCESLRLAPGNVGIVIQAAHMFKEVGEHARAEVLYLEAAALTPNDADLALQLGHFYRSTGRIAPAEQSYLRASKLKPGWDAPGAELDRLRKAGWKPAERGAKSDAGFARDGAEPLVEELAPRRPDALFVSHSESVELVSPGRRERTYWGIQPTVRGVEALRGKCISAVPIVELQIFLNDQLIHRGPVKGGYPLKHEGDRPELRKYVFNVWFDFSGFVDGQYDLDFRFVDGKRKIRSGGQRIVVARPMAAAVPDSDGLILRDGEDHVALDDWINAQPSMIRPGRRSLLAHPPRTVMVQRVDQLGDLVVSVPALRRLREIFPEARLIGLLSTANHELAATLGLFDEIVVVDFPEDKWEERRIMPAAEQERLRETLAAYSFDMAIDLSENVWSRYILLLSGAPFLYGFRSGTMPSMTVEIEGFTHDRRDRHEIVPHTNKLVGMIEWLAAMVRSEPNLAIREDVAWADLAVFDLAEGDRFIVLHDGARLQSSRWPHYLALVELLLERTDLEIVLLTDDPAMRAGLPPELSNARRFRLIDRRAAFDQFDALLSLCAVFVGNDSGPKHLASLRGAKVVSIHMARNNWNEWGQENGGFVLSRKVPCAGCLIQYNADECGKDFVCMTNISAEEVFGAVARLLPAPTS